MKVEERFLKYVSFETTSDSKSRTVPSSPKERVLAEYIAEELKAIGLSDVRLSDESYVYAALPASEGCEALPSIGFIAHMDTSESVSGKDIKPRIIDYKGGDIQLNDKVATTVEKFSYLKKFEGQRLIVTDGTTLLGADDKAGIAEIVSAMEYLLAHPEIKHGRIGVGFTPDEEIGRGADYFDIPGFGCEYAYTLDGGLVGGLVYENFNAASCVVKVHGINIHPGASKNKMKNAVLLLNEFISMMPPAETPAHTEKREGFYHISEICANESEGRLEMIIRDHDWQKFQVRKQFVQNLGAYLNGKYGEGSFELQIEDSYYNMYEKLKDKMYIIDRATDAMEALGIKPRISAARGGTDGSRLSYDGLPCPDLGTGGANYHGVNELVSIDQMEQAVALIVEIAKAK